MRNFPIFCIFSMKFFISYAQICQKGVGNPDIQQISNLSNPSYPSKLNKSILFNDNSSRYKWELMHVLRHFHKEHCRYKVYIPLYSVQ